MKYILLVFLVLPFYSMGQECHLIDEKDRFNQDPRLTTGFVSLGAGSDKFLLAISADKREIDYFFALDNSTICFDDYSRALVQFESKQRANYRNGGTSNCKGYFHFNFPNQERLNGNLVNLSERKIATIQFTDTGNNKKIITLRPEDQEAIFHMANCIAKELEKLRIDTWKPKQ